MNRFERLVRAAILSLILVTPAVAADLEFGQLRITGAGLELVTTTASTAPGVPTTIQTRFGGATNENAPFVQGLTAVAELTGPGLTEPLRLETTPGWPFRIPGLREQGSYTLLNVRLLKGETFVQQSVPAAASIQVVDVLGSSVTIEQLSAEEIRDLGLVLDSRNYEYYRYTVTVEVREGEYVQIPYIVIVDTRTGEVFSPDTDKNYSLPPDDPALPPRWEPPRVREIQLIPDGPSFPEPDQPVLEQSEPRPSIPAALVIPNEFAVLHDFFSVGLVVRNNAPEGSEIVLDRITASLDSSPELRLQGTTPAVSFGSAVPILDGSLTYLIAQAEGKAEWTLEGLKPGTHQITIEIEATLRTSGQEDIPLRASTKAAIQVHDDRFSVNFSHPDTIREGIEYSTFLFVTNVSGGFKHVEVQHGLQECPATTGNVCLAQGFVPRTSIDLEDGQTEIIEYRLQSTKTGSVFATAGTFDGDSINGSISLSMGVSPDGIPLSPATLVMPYYSRFLDDQFVADQLRLLGLGYSLATAPLTKQTAAFPQVTRSDIFHRAVDIARAGEHVFLKEKKVDAFTHLMLDLLGNDRALPEWDEFRRSQAVGDGDVARDAAASLVAQLESASFAEGLTPESFTDRAASITAYRGPYLLAFAHRGSATGDSGFALSIENPATGRRMAAPVQASSGHQRDLPWGEIASIAIGDDVGELGMVGRWVPTEDGSYDPLRVSVAPTSDFTLELIWPSLTPGEVLRATVPLKASGGGSLYVDLLPGSPNATVLDPKTGESIAVNGSLVTAPSVGITGAVQDLHVDEGGREVSVLFNRPVGVEDAAALYETFSLQPTFSGCGFTFSDARPAFSAALQPDGRVVHVNFEQTLSPNLGYTLQSQSLIDPVGGFTSPLAHVVETTIERGAVICGQVLKGDQTPIPGTQVQLFTKDGMQVTAARNGDGAFLLEHVPVDGRWNIWAVREDGTYTTTPGASRIRGQVSQVNLVFLGRGSAQGYVRYEDGTPVGNAAVSIGSTMFDELFQVRTDENGFYTVAGLPVGPLTFIARDEDGNVTYAADELQSPGAVAEQDLEIIRKPFPGTGTIRGIVVRSDDGGTTPVAGARVGVYSQSFAVESVYTGRDGRFVFEDVPAGFVTVLGANWSISREATAFDFELGAGETRDLTLTLVVSDGTQVTDVTGTVVRTNPLSGADEVVGNALVRIDGMPTVQADGTGFFRYAAVPLSKSGRTIDAWDPETDRYGSAVLPTLYAETPANVEIRINPPREDISATIRVKLVDARGYPVSSGYRVYEPGFGDAIDLVSTGDGIYELEDAAVKRTYGVWAVPLTSEPYGDQYATGTIRAEFAGQIATLVLKLPGQGTVRAKVRSAGLELITDATLSYLVWGGQELERKTVTLSTSENGAAGYATFTNVPAGQSFTLSSAHPVYANDSITARLGYDGDLQSYTLELSDLSTVRGTVFGIDAITPIAGATVRLTDGRQDLGTQLTGPDGTYEFGNVTSGVPVVVTAELTQSGIYRTGFATTATPENGGIVDGTEIILRRQGTVAGQVVYADYKVFDPENPENNVLDDTPDPSDNAPVPYARYWLRELSFPNRSFGTDEQPRTTDATGRFTIPNVFEGNLRVSGWDPNNEDQSLRGNETLVLDTEGAELTTVIAIGGTGFGPVTVTVIDPNNLEAPVPNAEVTLLKDGPFDFGTTNGAGEVRFEQVPASTYQVTAYSKALALSGVGTVSVSNIGGGSARIALESKGVVKGALSDPELDPETGGRPVPGAHVTLTASDYQTRTTTGTAGDFEFRGIRQGSLRFDAKDPNSNRRVRSDRFFPAGYSELTGVDLKLETISDLHLRAYLPDDGGGNSGVFAPLVAVDVVQRCRDSKGDISGWPCDYKRSIQGTGHLVFEDLFDYVIGSETIRQPYSIRVREIGGQERTVWIHDEFPLGLDSTPIDVVFPAFGDVRVLVSSAGAPVRNAFVRGSATGVSVSAYTDDAGLAVLRHLPLDKPVWIQATNDGLSGTSTAVITSQSTSAQASIELGSYVGLEGLVEAETGGPSIGTRVIAGSVETVTDGAGRFQVSGLLSGRSVEIVYYGPDHETIGARQTVTTPATGTLTVSTVKLDATPPRLLDVYPADGAIGVPPDAKLRFVFSEPLDPTVINNSHFQLRPADGSSTVSATFTSGVVGDGTFVVIMTPPPSGGDWPLRSDTLYRVILSKEIRDLSGHTLDGRALSFTTADRSEPEIVEIIPAENEPIQASTTFQLRFNEPLDESAGMVRLDELGSAGPTGADVRQIPVAVTLDPATLTTVYVAPSEPLPENSFFRLTVSGYRDAEGNAISQQAFHFGSRDSVKPTLTLSVPEAGGSPLVSGVQYGLVPAITNEDGTEATDIARVEYFAVENGSPRFLRSETKSPFVYTFVAPEGSAQIAFEAVVWDTSGNSNSETPAQISLDVVSNEPPSNVVIALDPAGETWAGHPLGAVVTFEDEGILATVHLDLSGANDDGSDWTHQETKEVRRNSAGEPWAGAAFEIDLPPTLAGGSVVSAAATVTDSRGLASSASASLAILSDATAPSVTITAPVADDRLQYRQTFEILSSVIDGETGPSSVTFSWDGGTRTIDVVQSLPGNDAGERIFRSGAIDVPVRYVDTRMVVTATARDFAGNESSDEVEVVVVGEENSEAPKAAWIQPLDRAILPAGEPALTVVLQVVAVDEPPVQSVTFEVEGVGTFAADPITGDLWQKPITFDTPSAGTTMPVRATVSDGDPANDVELPITLEFVAVDVPVTVTRAVGPSTAADYEGKTILVRGSSARFIPQVPLALANLIVLDGGTVSAEAATTISEYPLDLEIDGSLYVDASSGIDATGRGYLGGWGTNFDGSGNHADARGMTAGLTVEGGATPGASASHAGRGGVDSGSSTNDVYGSITAPVTLGSGGAGTPSGTKGASGGGALRLTGTTPESRIVIAGRIAADGGSGIGIAGAGAGGSVFVTSPSVILGASASVTANGGDDDSADGTSRGAGGGRVAIDAAARLDLPWILAGSSSNFSAHGGRNGGASEGTNRLDGGAGTIWLKRPGQQGGELVVSSFDDRYAASTHLTRPTPVAETLTLDRFEVGPRALTRLDAAPDATETIVDPTAVVVQPGERPSITYSTDPADGTALIQDGTLSVSWDAASAAGLGTVELLWSASPESHVDTTPSWPTSLAGRTMTLPIPYDAAPGEATLRLRVTDRAERTFETGFTPFTIVENRAPVIDSFVIDPASLEIYPGGTVTATVNASDDLAVRAITLTSSVGGGLPTQEARATSAQQATEVFTIDVPVDTAGGTTLNLEAEVSDQYPNRLATTTTRSVTILRDVEPPTITLNAPDEDALFSEGSGNTIDVHATIVDAEVGVKEAWLEFDGVSTAMTRVAPESSDWTTTIPVPSVDGSEVVTKSFTVRAVDFAGNESASAPRSIRIEPFYSPDAPVITWTCGSEGAMYPSGYVATLRVHAIGNATADATNGIDSTEFRYTNPSTGSEVVLPATPHPENANEYQATLTVPDGVDGDVVTIRAVVANIAGLSSDLTTTITIVEGERIAADLWIPDGDTSRDGQTLIIESGTTRIDGAHSFDRMIVLGGARLTHTPTDPSAIRSLELTAGQIFVACDGAIDATGRGFRGVVSKFGYTWENTTTGGSSVRAGGSHGGRGGNSYNGTVAESYGSIIWPRTPGGAGGLGTGSCTDCTAGGGVIEIDADSVHSEGSIVADGTSNGSPSGGTAAGAGGSIFIRTGNLSGTGKISARGGSIGDSAGGGGRISIWYEELMLPGSSITAAGGHRQYNTWEAKGHGSAGTLYLRQVDATGSTVTDQLIIENQGQTSWAPTELASLSPGTVVSVNGSEIELSEPVADWVEGSWIEFYDETQVLFSEYEIVSVTPTGVVVALPSGETSANTQAGHTYRSEWRFDAIRVEQSASLRAGGLESPVLQTDQSGWIDAEELTGDSLVLEGQVQTQSVRVGNLTLRNGAILTHPMTRATTEIFALDIRVDGNISVDATSRIDVTGRGFRGVLSKFGYTWKNTTTGGSSARAGGSHGGLGGNSYDGTVAKSYGSFIRPSTPGGAGGRGSGSCTDCTSGGGVISIEADSIEADGLLVADGASDGGTAAGAGGSIMIRARYLSGGGQIRARGGSIGDSAGGGGRVSVWYEQLSLPLESITAAGGHRQYNTWEAKGHGSAGTLYLRQVDATGSTVTDQLIIENQGQTSWAPTELASLAPGTVVSVSGAVIELSEPVSEWVIGSWIELYDDSRSLVSEYEIASVTATTVTVRLPGGETAANTQPGHFYRSEWRFGALTIRDANVETRGSLETTGPASITSGSLLTGNLWAPNLDPQLISLQTDPTGAMIVGAAGSVADEDQPVSVTATNVRTLQTFSGPANTDGSFSLPVDGIVGDTFTIHATDSHHWPMTSDEIPVTGAITETNSVESVTVDSAEVTGGLTATGTVSLTYTAIHGPKEVALTSSDATIASVPATVTVPQGASSATFPITTSSPQSATSVTITAQFVTSATATVTVNPDVQSELLAIRLSESRAWPGQTIPAIAELTTPAPAGGAVISLSSSDSTLLTVPASVSIAEGDTYALFDVVAGAFTTDQIVTITGTWGATRSTDLSLAICDPMPAVAPSSGATMSSTWFDDGAPVGSTENAAAGMWETEQFQSGSSSLHFAPMDGFRQYDFTDDPNGTALSDGDVIVAYVLVNPCNPPREIVLGWDDGSWEHRASWGEDLIETGAFKRRIGPMPEAGAWTRLEIPAAEVGLAGSTIKGMAFKVYDGEAWFDHVGFDSCSMTPTDPFALPLDEIWLDEPTGTIGGDGSWTTTAVLSGTTSLEMPAYDGFRQYVVTELAPMALAPDDRIVLYTLVDLCDVPREIMLGFYDGSWEHRAYWGEDLIENDVVRTDEGDLPQWGEWVRLEVTAAEAGLTGQPLTGIAFKAYDGHVWFDRVAIERGSN